MILKVNTYLSSIKTCTFGKYRFLYILIFIQSFILLTGQNSYSQKSELEYGLLNVGLGSLIGGIGAVINKENPEEKFETVLLRGMAQGALGGYLVFESKRLLKFIPKYENYNIVYPSKILNAAGNSFIENAARDDKFWSRWHINFGFSRIELLTEDQWKIRHRIMIFDFGYAMKYFVQREFDFRKSMQLGTLVFNTEFDHANGMVNGNLISLGPDSDFTTYRHELIHTYQYEQFSGINNYLDLVSIHLKARSSLYNTYSKIFYTDINLYTFWLLGELSDYDNGFLEKEAYELK